MLQIFNNLTRQKEPFNPILPGKVMMYVCGITVYDLCHVGHARTFINFDVITRYLRFVGYDLNYIRNITDIDDKIIQRANETGQDFRELTQFYIQAMHDDFDALGLLPPDHEPRATEHMDEIIAMIRSLMDQGFAYQGEHGDVYFDVSKFPDYGKLSGQDVEQLRAGARIDVADDKQDPVDFVLWKASKTGEPGWPSPWGEGRPGWHIECSAMSTYCLSDHFDIHGGGSDLKFPHHENEIAQSECATGEHYANVWMHTGMLQVDKEKMSKSLHNFFTIRDVLKDFDAEVVRFFMVNSHYRSPLSYSRDNLHQAQAALERFYTALRGLDVDSESKGDADSDASLIKNVAEFEQRFREAMDDDFNTPEAIAVLFELTREINRLKLTQPAQAIVYARLLKKLAGVLGHLQRDPEQFLKGKLDDDVEIEAFISAREQAREQKDWAESDRIRDILVEKGIVLEDSATGTVWRKA